MITLSQKPAVENRHEQKPIVNNDTLVTIPIQVYASMLAALPKVNFIEVKAGILEHLSGKNTEAEFLECLRSHVEQADFYMKSKEIVNEFETFLGMREAGKIDLRKSADI